MDAFGLGVTSYAPFDETVAQTRLALRSTGFGILSEMGGPPSIGEGRRHLFMSVWNQMVKGSNLGGEGLDVGDHLRCDMVVFEEEGAVLVACLDPTEGLEGWASAAAADAKRALEDVLRSVASGGLTAGQDT